MFVHIPTFGGGGGGDVNWCVGYQPTNQKLFYNQAFVIVPIFRSLDLILYQGYLINVLMFVCLNWKFRGN